MSKWKEIPSLLYVLMPIRVLPLFTGSQCPKSWVHGKKGLSIPFHCSLYLFIICITKLYILLNPSLSPFLFLPFSLSLSLSLCSHCHVSSSMTFLPPSYKDLMITLGPV